MRARGIQPIRLASVPPRVMSTPVRNRRGKPAVALSEPCARAGAHIARDQVIKEMVWRVAEVGGPNGMGTTNRIHARAKAIIK